MRFRVHALRLIHDKNAVRARHGLHLHHVAQLGADVADGDDRFLMGHPRDIGLVTAIHLPAGDALSAGLVAAFAAQ